MSHPPRDITDTTSEVPQIPWYPDLLGRVSFPPAAAADPVALTGGPVWRLADLAAFWQRPVAVVERWLLARRHPAPHRDPDGEPYWLPAEIRAYAAGDAGLSSRGASGRGSGAAAAARPVVSSPPAAAAAAPVVALAPPAVGERAEESDELPALLLVIGSEVVA